MRFIARFATEQDDCFEIITVYDVKSITERINKTTPTLRSISNKYPSAKWFEQKLSDDFGIKIRSSSRVEPLVTEQNSPKNIYPMRKIFNKLSIKRVEVKVHHLDEEQGIVFSPTHPYHLESSQFKYLQKENKFSYFETLPFSKYRGIEKMVEGMTLDEAKPIIERISGTSSIAYQLVYLDIQLQSSKRKLPSTLKVKHIFFLELERIINTLFDLGSMCQSVKFIEGNHFFMKLVEEGRLVMKLLTGHRFGFGAIDMQGNGLDITKGYEFIRKLGNELLWFEEWIEGNASFWKKLEGKGFIAKEDALQFGLVGIMARSTGLEIDRRQDKPLYKEYGFSVSEESMGDSAARFNIRLTEIYNSLRIMRRVLDNKVLPFFIGTNQDGKFYAYIESSGGELMMYVDIKDEKIERFFVRDPSFLNAQILPLCLKNSSVNALELIIKSIPLSFSAIDL